MSSTTTPKTVPSCLVRPSKPLSEQRIAVLGAGPAGLSVLCAFAEYAAKSPGAELPTLVCCERQDAMGGQWHLANKWQTGSSNEFGEPVHSGMYDNLWSNGPKECLEFANYSFLQHFQHDIPSYPPRAVLLDYMQGRARHLAVEPWIRFQTAVRRVTYDSDTTEFTVITQHLPSKQETSQTFDYVLCCTGHFHVPHFPTPVFDGLDSFAGRILHSHEVRHFEQFQGHRILVIGTLYSAEDMALQGYKFGCRDITLSYRTQPMAFDFPPEIVTKPLLVKMEGSTAHFLDGSTKEGIDIILFCTGYQHSFPFLEESLTLQTQNKLWIDGLYKGLVWHANPRFLYLAMHDQWLTFNMFDAQAWYARDVILGRLTVPEPAEREADMQTWADRHAKAVEAGHDEDLIRFQVDYTANLIQETDYPSWDYELTVQTLLDWEHAKHQNIMTDGAHTSAFTGSVAPKPKIPWMENTNDSLQAFLDNQQS